MSLIQFKMRSHMPHSERIFCNECGREQQHKVAASHDRSNVQRGVEITRTAEIIECAGCGYTILRRKVHFSEFQYQPGDIDPDPEYVPGPTVRQEPVWLASLSPIMSEAFSETVRALNYEMPYLAAVGVRTVLDMILVSKVGDSGTFEARLSRLEKKSHVTAPERQRLDVLAKVGNAAAHRGFGPNIEDLGIMVDILGRVVQKLYIDPDKDKELSNHAKRIGAGVPPRPRKGE
jgi:hypothetical protein